jgi:hypothetical protein
MSLTADISAELMTDFRPSFLFRLDDFLVRMWLLFAFL